MSDKPQITRQRLLQIIKEELGTLSETHFNVGDKVKATVKAQGMEVGKQYDVTDLHTRTTPFGDFVTYELTEPETGKKLNVGNAHLLVNRVKGVNEAVDHKSVSTITSVASKLLAAIEAFKGKAPAAALNAVSPHVDHVEKALEDMVANPTSFVDRPKLEPKKVTLKAVKNEGKLCEADNIINLAQEAFELTDEQVEAVKLQPKLMRYLKDEIKFTGDLHDAIINATAVFTDEQGNLHITDQDGAYFDYVWDDQFGVWNRVELAG